MSKLFWWLKSEQEQEQEGLEYGFYDIPPPKKRAKMSPEQLAIVLSECKTDSPQYILVAHELNRRIAKIQALPAYVGVVSGLVGVVLGVWLNSYFQEIPMVNCIYPVSAPKETKNETLNHPTPPLANTVPVEPIKSLGSSKPTQKITSCKNRNGNSKP